MRLASIIVVVAIACGGSPQQRPPAPPPADPVPMHEPVAVDAGAPVAAPTDAAPADPNAELLAAERAAFERAKPVFDRWCAKCHAKGGKNASAKKLGHFDMTTYPFGGHHAMEISGAIAKALGLTGKKPTMPADKKGAVQGEELALVKAWIDAFDAAHAGGAHGAAHDHGGHAH